MMYLRPKLERYGHILELSIDSSARLLRAEIQLLGQPEPLIISQALYRIDQKGPQPLLVFYNVKVSKEWVKNLLDDYFPELPMKIPEFLTKFLD